MPKKSSSSENGISRKSKVIKFVRNLLFQIFLGVCVALAVGWVLKVPRSLFATAVRYRIPTDAGFGFASAVVEKMNSELQEDCGYPKWFRILLGKHCVSLVFSPPHLKNMVVCQEFNTRRKDPEEALDAFAVQYAECIVIDKGNPNLWIIKKKYGGSMVKLPRTADTNYFFCNCDNSTIGNALPVVQENFGPAIK